jgi:23S rRNA (guanosine2251-2'-O)-methyltransferase
MTNSKYEQVYGFHAVQQVFATDISRVYELWVQEDRHDGKLAAMLTQAQQQGIAIHTVPRKTLDKLTQAAHHQGIVIRCQIRSLAIQPTVEACLAALTIPPFLLVLDEVQDPHNLGACLRTADAAGIQAIVIPKNRACRLSGVVRKVASGAADSIPLIPVTNLAMTLRWLQEQGVWLVGADSHSQISLFETRLTGPLALVLGSEGTGLRRLTREICDVLVHIPMLGTVASLNVSVAAGICLYEAVRQRTRLNS